MGGGLIDTRNDFPLALAKCRLYLISVVIGFFHSDYFIYVVITSKQFYNLHLLEAELSVIGQILQLTSATLFIVWTFDLLIHFTFLILKGKLYAHFGDFFTVVCNPFGEIVSDKVCLCRFISLLLFAKECHGFYVRSSWEKVKGGVFLELVSEFVKYFNVSCKGCGVAGDVDEGVGRKAVCYGL